MDGYTDTQIAEAVLDVVGDSKWEAVAVAKGYLAVKQGESLEAAARLMYEAGPHSLRHSRELVSAMEESGFVPLLTPRERTGSAQNPVTKLIPATVTEERFIEVLDDLCEQRTGLTYRDERKTDTKLIDFSIVEDGRELPINVKNAGTAFAKAKDLVGLDPEDCVPIPAYKAHAAVEAIPELLYVVSIDYTLTKALAALLPNLFSQQEAIVWDLLSKHSGPQIRSAEDSFIFKVVRRHWNQIKPAVAANPFSVISARKAVTILHDHPKRTPGIGLRAWGTGASAEVNVHVSVAEDMKAWNEVAARITKNGIEDIIRAVNRRVMREVPAPEI